LPNLHDTLKSRTAALHQQLDSLPFFGALEAGTLPTHAVVSFFRCLAIVHAVVENQLSAQVPGGSALEKLRSVVPTRTAQLTADLETLGASTLPSNTAAMRAALDCAADILAHAANPASLAGALYVLEGSQNGGVLLKKHYARCLQVREADLSYFESAAAAAASRWACFVEGLNELDFQEAEVREAADSALRCFRGFDAIVRALHPCTEADYAHHVAAVNFEAGSHAMPQDPREIALALTAGRAAWKAYPYLELRFGERGKRFTSSDSCWLVALTRMPVATATGSLEWLRSVLATRGLPTVILEEHLRAILLAFKSDFPDWSERSARYEPFFLKRAAERRCFGTEAVLSILIDEFDRNFRGYAGFQVESAAKLLTSAWVDENSGIPGALAATREWFTCDARFATPWIENVTALLVALDRIRVTPC
jgi:heme oxygenase